MAGERIKHLEFITQAIGRMAQNSFVARGWCVTVTSALLAIAIERSEARLVFPAVLAIAVFAAIDVFYLRQEKRFRELYDTVRETGDEQISFAMSPPPDCVPLRDAAFSPIIMLLYGGMLSVALVAAVVIGTADYPNESIEALANDPNT
ncbi:MULTISPECIES: hypothetical protein [Paracoccus]|uniref:Uncharacterized protein n=1 Tax=Paracoccus versutus TaxID=34007 RepID=A0A3D9XDB0_PARVE|nr:MULTISPECIES: hypothetical protein [Paracoccus]REF68394.1 hypothetical protein BDD41_3437 [Paracoccus versutus]WGR59050.1 hypothetical protein E3U25_24635 [Paracoccus versutus]SFY45776.1 hypothetical protein SAMN04244548_05352 [Paracoccus pantotrophus]